MKVSIASEISTLKQGIIAHFKEMLQITHKAFDAAGQNVSAKRLILALCLQFTFAGAKRAVFNSYFL